MQVKDMIKSRRIELGLTILDVAKAVGVSESTVSRWESGGIINMRRDRMNALAKVLQISPLDLLDTTIRGKEQNKSPADPKIDEALSEDDIKLRGLVSQLTEDQKRMLLAQLEVLLHK